MDNSRSIYANENDDITIIEILDNDKLGNYNLLEIEDPIYDNNINFYNEYNNKIIYILHYPEGTFASFSKNVIADIDKNNNIYHFCSTEGGSSWVPILDFDTLKVIGVHQAYGYFEKEKFHNEEIIKKNNYFNGDNKIICNLGKIIKESIYNFNKENKIILTLNINKDDIGKKIYFLQNYDKMKISLAEDIFWRIPKTKLKDIEHHKLNLNNFGILINDKIYKSKEYFIPESDGIYHIKIYIKNNIKDCLGLFYDCSNISNIDFSSFDTKNVTNMSWMFSHSWKITNIDLSFFNTENVIDMSHMFDHCERLININLSSFDTENVIDMSWMFSYCLKLSNIDLSSFNSKNLTDINHMFYYCENVTNIDLSSFHAENVTVCMKCLRDV